MIRWGVRIGVLFLLAYVVVTFFGSRIPSPLRAWLNSIDLPHVKVPVGEKDSRPAPNSVEARSEVARQVSPQDVGSPISDAPAPAGAESPAGTSMHPERKPSLSDLIQALQEIEGMADALGARPADFTTTETKP